MPTEIEKKILDAAMEVVAQEKISGTRMQLIAKEAGMSQANLHYHFSTKNDIMMALLENIQEEFGEERNKYIDVENKTVVENIRGYFDQKKADIIVNKKTEYTQFDFWVQGTVNEEIRARMQNTYNAWRKSISDVLSKGDFSANDDPKYLDMLPYMLVSIMLGASLQYLIDEGKFDLDEYFNMSEKILFGKFLKEEK